MRAATMSCLVVAGLFSTTVSSTALGESEGFAELETLQQGELAELNGRSPEAKVTVQNNQTLTATVSDTSFTADQINSGGIQLDSSALESFSGVGLFNFNTGNGNAIDAAIGVNIYLR